MKLTFAHGFTQTGRSWGPLVAALARQGHAVADMLTVDLAGHGDAGAVHAGPWESATMLIGAGGKGTYVGYSMGGRIALHAVLAFPDMVERLVLIGATPGIVDGDERSARRLADDRLADHIVDIGVSDFIDEWLANPLFAGLTPDTAQRADRLRNTAAGLASSLRLAGTGVQESLWDRLGDVACPVQLVVGATDTKFRAIADQMASRLPDATVTIIDDVGHSAHLEAPETTARAIATWLATQPVDVSLDTPLG